MGIAPTVLPLLFGTAPWERKTNKQKVYSYNGEEEKEGNIKDHHHHLLLDLIYDSWRNLLSKMAESFSWSPNISDDRQTDRQTDRRIPQCFCGVGIITIDRIFICMWIRNGLIGLLGFITLTEVLSNMRILFITMQFNHKNIVHFVFKEIL